MGFTGSKSRGWHSGIPPGVFREESVSLPFLVSGSCLHSLACGPFLYLQSQQYSIFKSVSVTLTILLPFQKDHCDYVGPLWIIQDILPISKSLTASAKYLLPSSVNIFTCSRKEVQQIVYYNLLKPYPGISYSMKTSFTLESKAAGNKYSFL